MRIHTTLLAISLAGIAPVLGQTTDSPDQEKAQRALEEKLKELEKPASPAAPRRPVAPPAAPAVFAEPAPAAIPVTEEQTKALEALRKTQAELDAQQPRSAPEKSPVPPAKPARAAKPSPPPVELGKPTDANLGPFTPLPVIAPDAEAQSRALEAVRQKQADLDAGKPEMAEAQKPALPMKMTEPPPARPAPVAEAPPPARARATGESRTVLVQPSVRTVLTQPLARTVLVRPASRSSSLGSPSASVGVPVPDNEAQAKALEAIRQKQAELSGLRTTSAIGTLPGGDAEAQARALEALRQKQNELNAENQKMWAARDADAAANRARAEESARRSRAAERAAVPTVDRTAPGTTEAAIADTRPKTAVATIETLPPPVVAPAVVAPADPAAQARALEALRQKEAELNAHRPQTGVEPAPAGTVTANKKEDRQPVSNPNEKSLAPGGTVDVTLPAGYVPTTRDEKLAELLRKYRADLITPREYHEERAKIIAEP